MNDVKGVFRNHLRERPFDFYVAFNLFLLGAWGIVDPRWPENYFNSATSTLVVLIGIYLMISSSFIITSLLCRRSRHPILALMGEMYGWLFISAASFALSILFLVGSFHHHQMSNNIHIWIIWSLIWMGLFVSSAIRSSDLYNFYRSLRK